MIGKSNSSTVGQKIVFDNISAIAKIKAPAGFSRWGSIGAIKDNQRVEPATPNATWFFEFPSPIKLFNFRWKDSDSVRWLEKWELYCSDDNEHWTEVERGTRERNYKITTMNFDYDGKHKYWRIELHCSVGSYLQGYFYGFTSTIYL